jgi:methionyl-tRNA formyltransferase
MTYPGPRIVFMGTPEFAVESLRAIIHAGYPVVGVVTSADKPSGRGLQLKPSAVKSFALEQGIPVLQPLKLKDPGFISELRDLKADLQVIVAFRMLPEEVWTMPSLGTFNLHASLLPQYRGAAPINWAVINGEKETGVTTFFLDHEIDTGKIILRERIPVSADENAGDVHDRLMITGANLVVKTLDLIRSGKVETIPQESSGPLKPAPKIFKNDCKIDWKKDTLSLYNFIRGLSPYPTAWTVLIDQKGQKINTKIFKASIFCRDARPCVSAENIPGHIETDSTSYLHVHTGDGKLSIEKIQIEGRKQMGITEFLNGFAMQGWVFML